MEIRNAYTLPRSARPYLNGGALKQVEKLTGENQELQRKLNEALETLARERVARRRAEVKALSAGATLEEMKKDESRTMRNVIDVVCTVWNCREGDLLAPSRARRGSRPRQAAFYLCKKYCEGATFGQIGLKFRRDHTTVMHGVETAAWRITNDQAYAEKMIRAETMLGGKAAANG